MKKKVQQWYFIFSTSERHSLKGHLKVRRLFLQCILIKENKIIIQYMATTRILFDNTAGHKNLNRKKINGKCLMAMFLSSINRSY
jgi:hypothetical protein